MTPIRITKEIKIAIVAIIGVIILIVGINFLKGINIFNRGTTYYVAFKDVSGLTPTNPIYADGYKVGTVKRINYDFSRGRDIMVEINVSPDLRIPKGSSAEIVSDLMGNVKVNLLLANNPHERIPEGGLIDGDINSGTLGELQAVVPDIIKMIPKLDSILTSLNQLAASKALRDGLNNTREVTANLVVTTDRLNTLMTSLNRQVPAMMEKTSRTIGHTEQFTAQLAALDIDKTMNEVNATISQLNTFTEQLNSNQGSLGLLMRDDKLYHNLNATASSADSLLIDLRKHPKRYVHFSIFGRKDK